MTMSDHTDDETPDSTATDGETAGLTGEGGPRAELQKTKERLETEADRAVSEFDEGIVDLLAWLLDTETRARIYVYLRQQPHSTSDEVAEGTGLYPSTVREALADLHDEDTVRREKRDSDSAGNNPYEYEAIAPSNLVRGVVGDVQRELNTVFNLEGALSDGEGDDGPVTITIDGDDEPDDDTASNADDDDDAVDIEINDTEDEDDA
ncbi:MAG: putative transcriptional regulator [Halonotius sp. J07HN6]|nr:MAG: putative transcriptional regulator [Halonotius sp. J07HN6]ERH05586.1 MAG: putative transcriptional regulator [Halonotius sp. J07HN4]